MNECVIEWCHRERVPSALYCRSHLTDLWHNRPVVVDQRSEPEWMRRRRTVGLPAKDMTRAA